MPLWSYATYLQNFTMAQAGTHGANWLGVTWSLAIEEQFYLLLPFLIRFVPANTLPKVCFLLVVAAPLFRISLYFFHEHQGMPGYVLLPARWDSLLLGVLGAYYLRDGKLRLWLKANQTRLLIFFGIGLAGSCGLIVANQSIASFGMSVFGHTWLALQGLTVILLAVSAERPMLRAVFCNRFLIWLGTISYGVYLYHQPLSGLFHHFFTGHKPYIANSFDALVTVMALLSTFGLAALSWKFFERPLVRLGQRIQYEAA
jgi:peptidoglycan/LPS O-acetylase OafA/YrhL